MQAQMFLAQAFAAGKDEEVEKAEADFNKAMADVEETDGPTLKPI
jgi:hypothetical protein